MNSSGWLQLALYVAALTLITKPMGLYLMQVLDAKGKTWLDPLVRPVERISYRLMGVHAGQ
ncbi:MAG: potassium-transporting ATPase subunit KdpA, partial [Verrucomicrobiota bacterium]